MTSNGWSRSALSTAERVENDLIEMHTETLGGDMAFSAASGIRS